jgi:hypothetical protein
MYGHADLVPWGVAMICGKRKDIHADRTRRDLNTR